MGGSGSSIGGASGAIGGAGSNGVVTKGSEAADARGAMVKAVISSSRAGAGGAGTRKGSPP